ncbi:MAG: DUF1700 domain-containing protein [Bacilli bacterium]
MNKKQFIKELEYKLSILDEQELKDTINEYKDIIELKVKSGITEEEAVLEFGAIDELATEILKAYKINPTKVNEEKGKDFENIIKKSAKTMANLSKEFFENVKTQDLSIELIFEIIIKFILLLVGLAILRLPFHVIDSLGMSILSIGMFPLDTALKALWTIATSLGYFVTCVLIIIVVFSPYFKSDIKTNKKPKKEEPKEESKKEPKKNNTLKSTCSGLTKGLLIIYKICMTLCLLLPLVLVEFILFGGLAFVVSYFFIGVRFIGLILIMIAFVIGTGWLTNIIYQFTFGIKKITVYPVFIAITLLVFGGVIFSTEILRIDYKNEAPKVNYETKKYKEVFEINNIDKIVCYYNNDIKYIKNNELKDNKIEIEVEFHSKFRSINDLDLVKLNDSNNYELVLNEIYLDDFNTFKENYNLVLKNLKQNKFYNYDKLYQSKIVITGNEKTLNAIKE